MDTLGKRIEYFHVCSPSRRENRVDGESDAFSGRNLENRKEIRQRNSVQMKGRWFEPNSGSC